MKFYKRIFSIIFSFIISLTISNADVVDVTNEFNDLILNNDNLEYPYLEERNDIGVFFDFAYDEVRVVVDAMSMQYLNGASIDYKEDLMNASFVINNPQASSTCGCGSSFAV